MDITSFLTKSSSPLLDVRSPCEFLHAHIPDAVSFPLFSDAERAEVGTLYKLKGRDEAVKLGLQFVGPKLASFVEKAEKLASPDKCLRLYCARGGMRSSSVAWLLQTAGFKCEVLVGGYKIFRRWALEQFEKTYHFHVLGGLTGSGKTDLLYDLLAEKEQIIDLEALANHKGSSYGHLGRNFQPSAEHFENLLAVALCRLDRDLPCWIEDESRMIGTCPVPKGIWTQMKQSPFFWIESSKEERIQRLMQDYGKHTTEELITATERLEKRLGGLKTREIVEAIRQNALGRAISLVLDYYDGAYLHSLKLRKIHATVEDGF